VFVSIDINGWPVLWGLHQGPWRRWSKQRGVTYTR